MSDLDLIIDLHLRNARQGPGGDEETRRALDLARLQPDAPLDVADLGCGTGASSLVLAQALDARIVAVDAAAPFVDRLRSRAAAAGVADRIDARVGRMEALELPAARFDVIWSEGAIYNMGFAEGVRAWRRFLRPGGVIAVSELTWSTSTRPTEIESYWRGAYPGVATASENLRRLEQAGYETLGLFFLPRRCWETNYYEPLRAGFPAFLQRHGDSEAARQLVAEDEAEMEVLRRHGAWYGYAFYVARHAGG